MNIFFIYELNVFTVLIGKTQNLRFGPQKLLEIFLDILSTSGCSELSNFWPRAILILLQPTQVMIGGIWTPLIDQPLA
jgi:hypothetical protein